MTHPFEQSGTPSAAGGQVPGGQHYHQGYVPDPQHAYYQQPDVPVTPQVYYAQPQPQTYAQPEPLAYRAQPQTPAGPQASYYARQPAPPVYYAVPGAGNPPGLGIHVSALDSAPPVGPIQGRKRWPWVAGGVVAFLAVAGAAAFAITAQSGPTAEEAKRACETAFINEMHARQEKAEDIDGPVVSDTNGVDVSDAYAIEGGFEVNGTGHYTIATPSMSVPGTVELTCTATQNDDKLVTTVVNREGTTTR